MSIQPLPALASRPALPTTVHGRPAATKKFPHYIHHYVIVYERFDRLTDNIFVFKYDKPRCVRPGFSKWIDK